MSIEFESLAFHLKYGEDSGFDALFRQAEQQLRKDKPEGFEVQEIGRLAWSKLPIEHYPAALRSLFYCYWLVDHQEQQEDQLLTDARLSGAGRADREALGQVNDALGCAAPDEDGCVPVEYEALRAVAYELAVLRRRLELLGSALNGGAS